MSMTQQPLSSKSKKDQPQIRQVIDVEKVIDEGLVENGEDENSKSELKIRMSRKLQDIMDTKVQAQESSNIPVAGPVVET